MICTAHPGTFYKERSNCLVHFVNVIFLTGNECLNFLYRFFIMIGKTCCNFIKHNHNVSCHPPDFAFHLNRVQINGRMHNRRNCRKAVMFVIIFSGFFHDFRYKTGNLVYKRKEQERCADIKDCMKHCNVGRHIVFRKARNDKVNKRKKRTE